MSDKHAPIFTNEQPLSAEQASRLLRIGMVGPARPSDPLLERLAETDGHEWLMGVIESGPAAAYGNPATLLAGGAISLEQLRFIKQICTERALDETHGARMAAMANYFISVAAGLAHFRTNLSSRPREDLEAVFLEFAALAPPLWADVFTRAIAVLSESP